MGTNVPNYRGMFLRGYGSQPSYHWGTTQHTSNALNTLQGDTSRNATGTVGVNTERAVNRATGVFLGVVNASVAKPNSPRMEYFASPVMWQFTWANFDLSRVMPTANENRPANMAVKYLILARD